MIIAWTPSSRTYLEGESLGIVERMNNMAVAPGSFKCQSGAFPEGVQIAIIADDLTGAMDTGAQFCRGGMLTIVYPDVNAIDDCENSTHECGPEVIVINTGTRGQPPAVAYDTVKTLCCKLQAMGVRCVYKKVDSTLRGNIGSELDAVMDSWNVDIACVAPAFPAMGRVTVGGDQLLHGKPIEATEMASDILAPVHDSHVPTLLSAQSRRKVAHIPLHCVREGVDKLVVSMRDAASRGFEILVIDSVTQTDLADVARAVAETHMPAVMCGSAGLAHALPQMLGFAGKHSKTVSSPERTVVVVSGSRSQVTRGQIEYLKERIQIKQFDLGLGTKPDMSIPELEELGTSMVDDMTQALANGDDIVISPSSGSGPPDAGGKPLDADDVAMSIAIARVLGTITMKVLESASVHGLVLTGGDTAADVCERLRVPRIALTDEILPGMPVGSVVGGPFDGLILVTKGGAFGDDDALLTAVRYIKGTD